MGRLCCRLKTRLAVEATGLAKKREEQMVELAGREEKKINSQGGAAALLGRDRFRFRVLFMLSPKSVKLPFPLLCVLWRPVFIGKNIARFPTSVVPCFFIQVWQGFINVSNSFSYKDSIRKEDFRINSTFRSDFLIYLGLLNGDKSDFSIFRMVIFGFLLFFS